MKAVSKKVVPCALFSLSLLACSAPVRADVQMLISVRTNAVTEGKSVETAQTYTLQIKGRKARREASDGTVVLYDREQNRVYTLDPRTRTCWSVPFREAIQRGSQLTGDAEQMFGMNLLMDLRQGKEDGTDPWRTIDGFNTRTLTVTGELSLYPKMPVGQEAAYRPEGRRSGPPGAPPNGFPGNGVPGNDRSSRQSAPSQSPPLPTFHASGELYVTDAMAALGVEKRDAVEISFALAQTLFPEDHPFLRVFSNRLGRRILLAGTLTVETLEVTPPPDASAENATEKSGGPNAARMPRLTRRTSTLATESLTAEVTLEDTLFEIPADYTQVSPPIVKSILPAPPQRRSNNRNGVVFAGDTP